MQRRGVVYLSGHSVAGVTSSTLVARASNEADARRRVAEALGVPDTFIRQVTQPPVWVYAPLAPEHADAFQVAMDPASDHIESVIEHESPRPGYEVVFSLAQASPPEAFAEARKLYAAVCARAGIPVPETLELRASGFEAFLPDERQELLQRAEDLLSDGHPDLAVVVAQTACEVRIAEVLRAVMEGHASEDLRDWVARRVTKYTLTDDATRDLWNRLTGTQLQKEQPWWEEYLKHVGRRNRIVHRGERVDVDAARASLEAVQSLMTFVDETVGPG